MKYSIKLYLFLTLASLSAIAFYFYNRQSPPQTYNSSAGETINEISEPTPIPPIRISITAENDTLEPNLLELVQHQDYILEINSVDKDYQFILNQFEVADLAPQGQVTEIFLTARALGRYEVNCGSTCRSEVNVSDNDEDTEFE